MAKISKYEQGKQRARAAAIKWQDEFCRTSPDWLKLKNDFDYFMKLARRYGLVTEFRENGII